MPAGTCWSEHLHAASSRALSTAWQPGSKDKPPSKQEVAPTSLLRFGSLLPYSTGPAVTESIRQGKTDRIPHLPGRPSKALGGHALEPSPPNLSGDSWEGGHCPTSSILPSTMPAPADFSLSFSSQLPGRRFPAPWQPKGGT